MNPVPEIDRAHTPKTAISEYQKELSIAAAMEVVPRFGLRASEAKPILRRVFQAVSDWRRTGRQLRIKVTTLDAYESAFEHPLMNEARKMLM